MMNIDVLQAVVQGQAERNIRQISISGYLSRMKVMSELLNVNEDIRMRELVMGDDGIPLKHTGKADFYLI